MKLVKMGKIFVASLCLAAMAAGSAVPALAVSPAGYTSFAAIEQVNSVDPAKVQAIRDALERIDASRSENGSWTLQSTYQNYEIENKNSFIMPWLFTKNNNQDLYFAMLIMSQDEDGYFYWNKADILYGEYNNFNRTTSYEIKNVKRAYATEDKSYFEMASFVGDDTDVEAMGAILSNETAYIRFNGGNVNGSQRTGTFLIDNETRQGITDIITLYNLLKDATPEERSAALNG